MTTKTMKYEIKFEKELYNLLSDIQYSVFRIKNKATTMAYDWQQFSFGYNERFGKYPKPKDIIGKVRIDSDIYNLIKDDYNYLSSSIIDNSIMESVKKFNNDKLKILKGEQAIPTYKRDGSFPIRATQIKNLTKINNKKYETKLSLLSPKGAKERGIKSQIPVELRTGKGANEILDRIINNEYKLSDSRISKIKNKFYLMIAYTFEPKKLELDKYKVMGIDLGVNIPAMLAINDDEYYKAHIGNSDEIKNFEKQMYSRYRKLQESRKWAGEGSCGHGRKTRMKPLEKLLGKIANYKDQKNHVWSREIVNEAIKHGCGTIQMEDLTGISEHNKFLKRWTFYDLQTKIEYKAKEVGIEVVKIDPKHTSGRCSKCGHIHRSKDKEQWRPTQDKFICQSCGYTTNADYNASKNISIKDIDKIIEKDLKVQGKVLVSHT